MHRPLAFALLLVMMAAVPWSAEPVSPELLPPAERDAFLAELEDHLGRVASVSVRFRQERHLEIFDEPVVSEGHLAFVRPIPEPTRSSGSHPG